MEQKWEQSLNAQVEPVALLRRLPSLEHMGQMGLARQLGVDAGESGCISPVCQGMCPASLQNRSAPEMLGERRFTQLEICVLEALHTPRCA